jgi:anaerobic ribonucleoside-triphosphate reductase activating protein
MINVAKTLRKSRCNGHGTRFVLWVQGCNRRCAGCFNPQYQQHTTNTLISVKTLLSEVLSTPGINGITISGGEPMLQAKELSELAKAVRSNGLSVLVFTGYSEKELNDSNDPDMRALIDNSDMIIAGQYDPNYPSSIPMIGSSNQVVMNITGRLPDPHDDDIPRCEVICDGKTVTLSGFPTTAEMESFTKQFCC